MATPRTRLIAALLAGALPVLATACGSSSSSARTPSPYSALTAAPGTTAAAGPASPPTSVSPFSPPGAATTATPLDEAWRIVAFSFVRPTEGWLVRMRGYNRGPMQVLHTLDGGHTWSTQYDAIDPIPVAMQFVDASHGWIVGTTGYGPFGGDAGCHQDVHKECQGAVLSTSDGGKTWHLATPTLLWPTEAHFVDADHGWMLAPNSCHGIGCNGQDMSVLRTSDSGATWGATVVAHLDLAIGTMLSATLEAFDASHAIVLGAQEQYGTSDAGATWPATPSPCSQSGGLGLSFDRVTASFALPPSSAWLICTSWNGAASTDAKALVHTSDGGKTWKLLAETGVPPGVGELSIGGAGVALQFLDPLHGWYASGGPESFIYSTSDSGSTWSQIETPGVALTELQFADAAHGWIAGGDGQQLAGTTDGGRHWALLRLPD